MTVQKLTVKTASEDKKQQVIDILEQFLADAKNGRYDSILIVADMTTSEEFHWAWTRSDDLIGLVGRLEKFKHFTLQRMER